MFTDAQNTDDHQEGAAAAKLASAPNFAAVEANLYTFSCYTTSGGKLCKKLGLNEKGRVKSLATVDMNRGHYERLTCTGLRDFVEIRSGCTQLQALGYGVALKNGALLKSTEIVTKQDYKNDIGEVRTGTSTAICRTKVPFEAPSLNNIEGVCLTPAETVPQFFVWFAGPSIMMIDVEFGGRKPLSIEELEAILCNHRLLPWYKDAERVWLASTSGNVWHKDVCVSEAGKMRLYIGVDDGRNIPYLGTILFEVLAQRGLVWRSPAKVNKRTGTAARNIRCPFDLMVYSPERIDYCAPPELEEGLCKRPDGPVFHGSKMVCTEEAIAHSLALGGPGKVEWREWAGQSSEVQASLFLDDVKHERLLPDPGELPSQPSNDNAKRAIRPGTVRSDGEQFTPEPDGVFVCPPYELTAGDRALLKEQGFSDFEVKEYLRRLNGERERLLTGLAGTSEGGRDDALMHCVCRIGKYVHWGFYSKEALFCDLEAALKANGLWQDEGGDGWLRAKIEHLLHYSEENDLPHVESAEEAFAGAVGAQETGSGPLPPAAAQQQEASARPGGRKVEFVSGADILEEDTEWLHPEYIAFGEMTVISGASEVGKGHLLSYYAAQVTTGAPWPNAGGVCPMGSVIYLSAEENPGKTLVPRLRASGADLRKVRLLKSATDEKGRKTRLSLKKDLDQVEHELRRLGDVKLVIIDPITSYADDTNPNADQEVRELLDPLNEWVQQHGIALMYVKHHKKGKDAGKSKVAGSGEWVNVPRLAYSVLEHPEDKEKPEKERRRLFCREKNSLGGDVHTLVFHIETAYVPKPDGGQRKTSKLVMHEGISDYTADEAYGMKVRHDEEMIRAASDGGKLELKVQQALLDILRGGPQSAKAIEEMLIMKGLPGSGGTVKRAKRNLRIVNTEAGKGRGGSIWSLPPELMGVGVPSLDRFH
jgi:putative DNA primase/helicase